MDFRDGERSHIDALVPLAQQHWINTLSALIRSLACGCDMLVCCFCAKRACVYYIHLVCAVCPSVLCCRFERIHSSDAENIFEDYCVDLEDELEKPKLEMKQILKSSGVDIRHDDTVRERGGRYEMRVGCGGRGRWAERGGVGMHFVVFVFQRRSLR